MQYLIIKDKPKNRIVFLRKKFNRLNYEKIKKLTFIPKISEFSAIIAKNNKIRKY